MTVHQKRKTSHEMFIIISG